MAGCDRGGGVYVESGATLVLAGGTVTGNRALQGGDASRAEAATMLMRYCSRLGE